LLTGCLPIRYLAQAGAGQDQIARNQLDVDMLVSGGWLTKERRALLAEVAQIKAYGEAHGLRATSNYTTYVDLHRPQVLWVTTACEPLRFHPRVQWFPIVGDVSYLGWFRREDADEFAAELRGKGWDVDVRGSAAYSTLGYFPDPILSTMFDDGKTARGELVNTILHESLHATFFVAGQSTLNESVASFVGDALAATYMRERVGPDAEETKAYFEQEASGERRTELFRTAYSALERLYASSRSREEKLAEKARILARLREEAHVQRQLTNATLVQYKTYGSGKAEMAAMLERCGSFPRLIAELESLRPTFESQKTERDPAKLLGPHVATACPPK
jgi:predicted aminopeptidase